MTSIKYYIISLSIYSIEVLLIFFLEKVFYQDIVSINLGIRIVSCIIAAYIYKNYLFPDAENFYKKFLIIASIVPIISTLILLSLLKLIILKLVILKIMSDILSSIIGFIVLRLIIRK